MKRKIIAPILAAALLLSNGITAFAAPEVINVGGVNTVFDAEYYASANPDVMAAFGTNRDLLVQHYTMFGISENRAAYAPGTDVNVINALLEAANTTPVQQTVVTPVQKKKIKSKIESWEGGNTTQTYTYTYDAQGNVLTENMVEKIGMSTWTYAYTYIYTYDAQGNAVTGTKVDSDNGTIYCTYTYDAQGNALTEVSDTGYTTTFTYDAQGNMLTWSEEEGTTTFAYTYDGQGNILTKTTFYVYGNNDTITYTYTYDAQGNVETATEFGSDGDINQTTTYTYY